MKNRECDIIKDLLPSYVDNICSEASNEWIEEHLAGCEDCRASAELMKNTEISAKRLEQELLDAVKKIAMQNLRRSVFGLGLCFFMLVMVVCILAYDRYYGQMPLMVSYMAVPVCMAMSWLVGRNQSKLRKWDKWDTVSLAAVAVSACYGVGLMFFGLPHIQTERSLFGVPWTEVGPFIDGQLIWCLGICLILYLVQMGRMIKQGRAGSVVMNLCLVTVLLMLNYHLHLGTIDSFDALMRSLVSSTVAILVIGGGITVLFAVQDRPKKEKGL